MTITNPQVERGLRKIFKYFNRFMLLIWRLGLGSWFQFWPKVSGQVLVITHTGRKTGLMRRTPVNYALVDGEIYCIAAFGDQTDWYQNILKHPDVEVWLPGSRWAAVAEDASDNGERTEFIRQVMIGSGFAAYLFGVNPHIPDERLDEITANYRLIRIHRQEARTGEGGPGDLAWIWPLATFILLPLVFQRRKKR